MKFKSFVVAIAVLGIGSAGTADTFAQGTIQTQQPSAVPFDIAQLKQLRAEYEMAKPDAEKKLLDEIIQMTGQAVLMKKQKMDDMAKATATQEEMEVAQVELTTMEQLHTDLSKQAEIQVPKPETLQLIDQFINLFGNQPPAPVPPVQGK